MKKNESGFAQVAPAARLGLSLRQRAEKMAQEKEGFSSCDPHSVPQVEMQQKLHDLLVHQIELEMQNDELRCAQAELEEARACYLGLYDLAPIGYCTLSESGMIQQVNLTAASLLGVPRGALIHQPITRFIHEEDQDAYYLYQLRLFETGEPQSRELRMMKRDGTSFWAHLSANTLLDGDGATQCRVVLSDITDRKNIEMELRKTAEELEQKEKLVTDFFINISHELKTPITLISLAVEIIETYLEQPKLNRAGMIKRTMIMKQNAYRLSRLVGNILDITKMDAGFMEPKFAAVDIVRLIHTLAESMESFAQKKGLSLLFCESAKTKTMPSDSQIVERIILNLVSNAIKHTPKSGHIWINCFDMDSKVVISVRDDGEGIPEEKKSIIFDRFRQVNTSLTRSSEGSGIGLSLTKSLVELLCGRIWFVSTLNAGSEFFVELPVLQMKEQLLPIMQDGIAMEKRILMELSDLDFGQFILHSIDKPLQ